MALFAVFVASCTSAPNGDLGLDAPGYNAQSLPASSAPGDVAAADPAIVSTPPMPIMSAEGDTELPQEVAYLPAANPVAAFPVPPAIAEASTGSTPENAEIAPATVAAEADTPQALTETAALSEETATAPVPAERPDAAAVQDSATDAGLEQAIATSAEPVQDLVPSPKKKSFLSSFFGSTPAAAQTAARSGQSANPLFKQQAKPLIEREQAKPVLQIATAGPEPKPLVMASLGNDNALPGVRQTALFEIKRKSGLDDESDVDLHEDEEGPAVRLASAAGLARLAPNGLLKQTETVDVACLKPSLVRVLKMIEKHYGRPMMVTSGYRSPSHNRRARGAKNSLHMYCAAADVQVPGVAKWELANFVRSMPGRGGVGTYCHTESVHVDVGPERDWNWRCRRRK